MRIGLALSGGGTRAAVFHLGVLARLAKGGLLEHVTRISTVSGGSLVIALVFSHAGLKWPSSKEYVEQVLPELRTLLTTVDLFTVRSLLQSPRQWPRLPNNRARVVASLLERRWKVRGLIKELPLTPEWLINTTCIETGKNWRFSRSVMGDWKAGHHYDPPFLLAEAAAASAAVPYAIGALKLRMPVDGWYAIDPATDLPRDRKARSFEKVALWDGGAYENLGLEPLYKVDRGMVDCDFVIVSDASGPLPTGKRSLLGPMMRGNLAGPRVFDIASDQIRSLRSRMFVDALLREKAVGALLRMGNSVRDIDIRSGQIKARERYANFQSDADAAATLKHPTNLAHIDSDMFTAIARNGFEVADATFGAYCEALAPSRFSWSE